MKGVLGIFPLKPSDPNPNGGGFLNNQRLDGYFQKVMFYL